MNEIQEFRKLIKVTQEGFSDLLGVSIETVRKWEQGRAKPSRLANEKLAKLIKKYKKTGAVQ